MKILPFLPLTLFACFAVTVRAADPTEDAAPFPTPPMQSKPWTPPATKLPVTMVNSIKELFDQGMADPRGCEYREVEIDFWGGGQKQKVHAWVLPGGGKTRYAVGWNGRVNAVASVGDAVDLRKDFSADTHGLGQFGIDTRWRVGDFRSLLQNVPLPIKVALLLRLGEADLAEGVWAEGYKGNGNMLANDPYSEMAREWLDCWYGRALQAHLKGDDKLALAMFRGLVQAKKSVEAGVDKHGVTGLQPGQHFLDELGQLTDLAADQERRAKEPPHVPALKSDLRGDARITALVRDLELVHGEQLMNPGETELTIDPIVQALIKEGDPAVAPLIACLDENPPRMTHTMFTQGMMGEGPVEYVYEPAYVILTAILKTTVLIPLPDGANPHRLTLDERKALAAKFRNYWAKYKSVPPEERWFSVLADDHATPHEWIEMAGNITQHTNQASMGPHLFSGSSWGAGPADHSAPMRGEALRSKNGPSVSDLLIKRFGELLPQVKESGDTPPSGTDITFSSLGNLLFALADWDGKGRADDIRKLTAQFNEKFPNAEEAFNSSAQVNATLYEKRLAAGDPTAIPEYTKWISSLQGGDYSPDIFHILWQHPNDPDISKAAETMFREKASQWGFHAEHSLRNMVASPMLGIPPFREMVLATLDNTSPIGYARRYRPDNLYIHFYDEEPEDVRLGAPPKAEFRMCDYYAKALSDIGVFPAFELDMPQEKRDAAVATCKALLKQYGGAFQAVPENLDPLNQRLPNFPRADHPATPDDVAQGRAIFSLTGTTRIWPMPARPLFATRPALKEDPHESVGVDQNGKQVKTILYDRNGFVWQAEEVLVDGKWERFYGFAGAHHLEKVPAAEIEFPSVSNYSWVSVAPFFDATLEGPETKKVGENDYIATHVTTMDAPLTVTVKLRNYGGLPNKVPDALVLPAGAQKALPPALQLILAYSAKIPPNAIDPSAPSSTDFDPIGFPKPFDYGEWHELPLRKEITIAAGGATGPLVDATCELDILKIELRDYFDLSKPGSYMLTAGFHVPGSPEAKWQRAIFTIVEKGH